MSVVLALALALWSTTERASGPGMSMYQLRADGEAIYWLTCPGLMQPCSLNRLATSAKEPQVLTADFQPGGVYAIDRDSVYMTTQIGIVQFPKSGGSPRVLAKVDGWIHDLQIAGDWIYVSTGDTFGMDGPSPNPRHGTIVRFPKAGGVVTKLVETSSSNPQMVIDGRRIYFVGDRTVQSIPIEGGSVRTLARDDANPVMSIAADRDAIYVAAGGEVRRLPKAGGAASVLYKAHIILKVRVENGWVYAARNLAYGREGIIEKAAIVRIPASGGKAEVIAAPAESPQDLAVSSPHVFVLLSSLGDANHPDRIVALR